MKWKREHALVPGAVAALLATLGYAFWLMSNAEHGAAAAIIGALATIFAGGLAFFGAVRVYEAQDRDAVIRQLIASRTALLKCRHLRSEARQHGLTQEQVFEKLVKLRDASADNDYMALAHARYMGKDASMFNLLYNYTLETAQGDDKSSNCARNSFDSLSFDMERSLLLRIRELSHGRSAKHLSVHGYIVQSAYDYENCHRAIVVPTVREKP